MAGKSISKRIGHRGRLKQIPIYLGKFFRMFVYMDDWKVLPMAALIAGLVSVVVGRNMFVSMEGALMGSLALTCVCIWNGFFNSIQVVCRERDIVKREHRSGMHISSYLCAHMIYQAFLCICQTAITIFVCHIVGIAFPKQGFVTPWFDVDIAITLFLVTYASDMLSLLISCIAKTTTSAMTIMPFMLIFELLFSGSIFKLSGKMEILTNLSIAKWGLNCVAAQSGYNDMPMVAVWNQLFKFKDYEVLGIKPVGELIGFMSENNLVNEFNLFIGRNAQNPAYETSMQNIGNCWVVLGMFAVLFAVAAVIMLERIDKDKR